MRDMSSSLCIGVQGLPNGYLGTKCHTILAAYFLDYNWKGYLAEKAPETERSSCFGAVIVEKQQYVMTGWKILLDFAGESAPQLHYRLQNAQKNLYTTNSIHLWAIGC